MAYLVILTGHRVDDIVELNPGATLTVGSDAGAHIQIPDAHVAPIHGQVYPAEGSYWFQDVGQGYTLVNLDPLANNAHALRPNDVIVLGRTFLKYVFDPPKAERLKEDAADELNERDAEIRRLRERLLTQQGEASKLARNAAELGKQAERDAASIRQLQGERDEAQAALAGLRDGDQRAQSEAAEALEGKRAAEAAQQAATAELTAAREELSRLGLELAEARADAEEQRSLVTRAESEREQAERATVEAREASEAAQGELAAERQALDELRAELERTQAELDGARAAGTAEDLAFAAGALAAARDALEALGVPREGAALPRRNADDAGALIARALPAEAATKLESKLALWVEQESLRRLAGTAPSFERDPDTSELEDKLRTLRQTSEQTHATRALEGRK